MTTSLRNLAAFTALVVAAAATCTVSTTGAPCDSIDNCPKGQFCSVEGTCRTNQKDAPCETDAHCPAGEYCAYGTCAVGEAPADAGADAGGDDAGGTGDAGQVNCAIDANCMTEHVTLGACVDGRCQLTCEQGWEDKNGDPIDGCEHERACAATGETPIGEECAMTSECACGAGTSHCVKGLVEYMGFGADRGVCLEDCADAKPCKDTRARCVPTKMGENGKALVQSCFQTGGLTGAFSIVVREACKDVPGDSRAGLMNISLAPYFPEFNIFTACKERSGADKIVVVQGFKICDVQNTLPCSDILYLYLREDALAGAKTEIPYVDGQGKPYFGGLYLWAFFESGAIKKMAVRASVSGGRIFNFVKTGTTAIGPEYKGDVDMELMKYDITVCGGKSGKVCPQL